MRQFNATSQEPPGVCPNPLCKSNQLDYGASEPLDESIGYPFTCEACGTEGIEFYDLSFSETRWDDPMVSLEQEVIDDVKRVIYNNLRRFSNDEPNSLRGRHWDAEAVAEGIRRTDKYSEDCIRNVFRSHFPRQDKPYEGADVCPPKAGDTLTTKDQEDESDVNLFRGKATGAILDYLHDQKTESDYLSANALIEELKRELPNLLIRVYEEGVW